MANLSKARLIDPIKKAVAIDKKPFLGICLGMQLIARSSEENLHAQEDTPCEGLDLFPGEVVKINVPPEIRLPHIGWHEVTIHQPKPFFDNIREEMVVSIRTQLPNEMRE